MNNTILDQNIIDEQLISIVKNISPFDQIEQEHIENCKVCYDKNYF